MGGYTVTVMDANGCSVMDSSVTITEPAVLAVPTSTTDATCGNADGSATAAPTGGTAPYLYTWDDPGTQTNATAGSIAAGNYNVTVTDDNGCAANGAATVNTSGGLTTSVSSSTNASCFGICDGIISINVSGGTAPFTYAWDDPGTQSAQVATGLCAGTFNVTITDNSGCQSTESQVLTEPGEIILSVSITFSTCGNADGSATVNASGGTGPYTYSWDDPSTQTTSTAVLLSAGSYNVIVTNTIGCTANISASVSDSSSLVTSITGTSNNLCFGDCNGISTVSASGGTSPYTYTWDDPSTQTTTSATGLCAGVYLVSVEDAAGCLSLKNDTITEPTQLTLSMSTTDATTGNSDGTATATPSGGTGLYTYLWNDTGTQSTSTATGLGAGTYTVLVLEFNGCSVIDSVTVIESGGGGSLTVSISFNTNVDCFGECDALASSNVSGGVSPYTYVWNDPSVQTNPTATGLCVGSYNVQVTDSVGAFGSTTVTITGSPEIITAMSSTSANCGTPDGSATVGATGGTGSFNYSWNDPSSQTTSTATNLTPNDYIVSVTDGNNCTVSDTVTVANAGAITASIIFNTDLDCNGDCDGLASSSVNGGTAPYTYLWDDPAAQTNTTAVDLCAGFYTVNITDAGGCNATDTVTIYEPTAINVAITENDVSPGACDGIAGANVTGGVGPYTYQWNDPSSQTNANAANLCPGNYGVTVTDANGCIKNGFATISDPSVGILTLDSKVDIKVYPNPNSGSFELQIETGGEQIDEVRIMDLMGRKIFYMDIDSKDREQQIPIDLANVQAGVYEIHVMTQAGLKRKTIVIQ